MFIIIGRVSGGYTGTREAVVKQNGIERQFTVRAEAEAEAKRLTDDMNSNPYRTATFAYWVEEV